MCKLVGVNPYWVLITIAGWFLSSIPLVNLVSAVASIYFTILLNVSIAKAFGKDTGFAIGLIFLPYIFYPILGLGNKEFVGKNPMEDIIFKNTNQQSNTNNQNVQNKNINETTNEKNEPINQQEYKIKNNLKQLFVQIVVLILIKKIFFVLIVEQKENKSIEEYSYFFCIIFIEWRSHMINKQNLWFLTLFSLILVLGVYYVTMPNDLLTKVNIKTEETKDKAVVEEVKEESALIAMRVSLEEERKESIDVLQEKITNEKLTTEEKNNAYEQLKYLNELQGKEETIEKNLKKEYDLDCFTKIDNKDVSVICISSKHDATLANNIMRTIQKDYKTKMNITVKFQKK